MGVILRQGVREMGTSLELRTSQKDKLFDLLVIAMENEKAGIEVIGLKSVITKSKALMEQEDIAFVEKMVKELA
jgi:hypothetical protein